MTGDLRSILAAALLAGAAPAGAQGGAMHGMHMPGMAMPDTAKPAPTKPIAKPRPVAPRRPAAKPPASPAPAPGGEHAGHAGHSDMPAMSAPDSGHAGHAMDAMPAMQAPVGAGEEAGQPTGTALPAGNAAPPPTPQDHAADAVYAPADMAMARHHLWQHHGGGTFHQVMLNLAEAQVQSGRNGYRWDGEAWYGGDIDRLWVKSEGEGRFGDGLDEGEVQALYSRAIDPYFNLQAGVRQDFGRGPDRTYGAVSIEGLAPGFLELEGSLFLSTKGDLLARAEGYYDQRITQRLILQPRVELNFAAQDVPSRRISSGLIDAELGLRLRYEIAREFAPYVGISHIRKSGDSARLTRAAGEDARATSLVIGLRTWF